MKDAELTKEEDRELLDSLPVFIHTTSGKRPTEKQLINLVKLQKKRIIKNRKTNERRTI